MKFLTRGLFSVLFILLFSSCSWVEYFILINSTNEQIEVIYRFNEVENSYQLKSSGGGGFPLFDERFSIYRLKDNGKVDWEKEYQASDKDPSKTTVHIILPPNTGFLFERFSNMHFESSDQDFHGKVFNFKEIVVKGEDHYTRITKENFDEHFQTDDGYIWYKVE